MKQTEEPDLRYAWYVVLVLMVCYTLSFIDRQILSLLVGPIKQDLGISDVQTSLLQGLAFALFYTTMGIPIARLADRRSRRTIIAVGVFFWSIMTALCAAARSFWTLFAARMGVGVGEAALGPGAFSMISDYFPKEKLARALSVYSMGIFIGSGIAFIVGGIVVQSVIQLPSVTIPIFGTMASWRLTFLIVGLPGVLIAILAYTLREPTRRNLLRAADGSVSKPSVSEVLAQMKLRWQSVVGCSLGMACQAGSNYALLFWLPEFFIRTHGWNRAQVGTVLGVIILTTGCVGIYFGGWICDRWQKQGIREAPLKVACIAGIGAAIAGSLATIVPSSAGTIALLVPTFFFTSLPVGSSYASLQLIFPNQLRGQIAAVFLFAISLFGQSLGPTLPALFTDYVFRDEKMVGYSISVTMVLASLATAVLFRMTYAPYRVHHKMLHDAPPA